MKRKISIICSFVLSIILSLALVGCGNKEKPATATPSPSSNPAASSENTDDATVKEEDEDFTEEEPTGEEYTEYDLDALAENITEAYSGMTEDGNFIGFGIHEDGTYAIVMFYSPEEHVTFVGPATINGDYISIVDEVTETEISFEVLYGDDEGIVIDLGDLGGGVLVVSTVDELLQDLTDVVNNTYEVE